ncbi:MAG TPA: cytochrome c [Conexibacter sp.]|jgi:mono/diheme cytochrome c family protein|nr:cytochrome c [Conexibacter sp.]
MRPIHALPVVLVAAALAGCGGGGSSSDSTTSGSATPPATTQQQSGSTQTGTKATTTTPKTTATKPATDPDGAKVFASAGCASCHTLAAAGSSGSVGPNLDDLKPGFDIVKTQVENGGGGMPSFSGNLSPAEIDAVARYVSGNAGR